MNNKITIWAIIAVVVAFGGLAYLLVHFTGGNAGTVPTATTTPSVSTSTPPAPSTASKSITPPAKKPTATTAKVVGVGSLSYLIGLKQPLVCSVRTIGALQRSGTVYVADGQMRGNFVDSSMIDDGSYLYAWMSGASKGLKLLAASSVSGSAIASNGGIDLESNLSFACNPWVSNASVFTPPSSVSFSNSL